MSNKQVEILADLFTILAGVIAYIALLISIYPFLKTRKVWLGAFTAVSLFVLIWLLAISNNLLEQNDEAKLSPLVTNDPGVTPEIVLSATSTEPKDEVVREVPILTKEPVIDTPSPLYRDFQDIEDLFEEVRTKGRREALLHCDPSFLGNYYIKQALSDNEASISKYCTNTAPNCYMNINVTNQKINFLNITGNFGSGEITKTEDRVYICNDPNHVLATPVYGDTYTALFSVEKIDGRWFISYIGAK